MSTKMCKRIALDVLVVKVYVIFSLPHHHHHHPSHLLSSTCHQIYIVYLSLSFSLDARTAYMKTVVKRMQSLRGRIFK